ncbi:MAG: alcohol dehydrogenase catalytic domain-containing protein [Thermodesulfobacteriota bacterium]|nr:alcohol dehydrogenase catalytic domain-containing protein [Thermodesulfobacteriota bacterium]
MKAAILKEPGRLEIREVRSPECPAGGVLVKVKACGICSADAKMVAQGHRALNYPRIPGHEIAGVIEQSRTNAFKEGSRIQIAPGLRCGRCSYCLKGMDNLCPNREILGFTYNGGFAEYIAIPIEDGIVGSLNIIPEEVSYNHATLAEPLACCINAQNKIHITKNDTVLITGAGPLGLLHAFVARHKGAEHVLISEPQLHRRKTAIHTWADTVIDPGTDYMTEKVMAATHNNGVDAVIFACSQVGLNEPFMKLLAPAGRVSIFSGIAAQFSQSSIDFNQIHYNEFFISGAYGCTADQNRNAMDLISSEPRLAQKLITHYINLDNIHQGIEHTASQKGLKTIVEVSHE